VGLKLHKYIPVTECIDVDITKCLSAAMQELALSGCTLKLDLVIIVDLLSNSLYFDAWMEFEDAPDTVLPLQIHLWSSNESLQRMNSVSFTVQPGIHTPLKSSPSHAACKWCELILANYLLVFL
jgi:hypothetical protein